MDYPQTPLEAATERAWLKNHRAIHPRPSVASGWIVPGCVALVELVILALAAVAWLVF